MATRHRLDHDLDPNQHRMLGCRGADLTFTAGGDLTLGQGNYFQVGPTSTAVLRRISAIDWTQGSPVTIRAAAAFSITPGATSGGGFFGLRTKGGVTASVELGDCFQITYDGEAWVVMAPVSGEVISTSDHKVSIDAADNAAGTWDYLQAKLTSPSLSVNVARAGDALPYVALDVNCSPEIPLEGCPGGNSGTQDGADAKARPAHFRHQHPLPDVETLGATLYAEHVTDPALHPSVASIFCLETGAVDSVLFADAYGGEGIFAEIRPGVFQAKTAGVDQWSAYTHGVTPYKGMRSVAVRPPDLWPLLDVDKPRQGIYVWTNPGFEGTPGESDYRPTYAVLERADDANSADDFANGFVVQVTGGSYAGKFYRMTTTPPIVLGTTALAFEELSSYTLVASDNLLTAAQLSTASTEANQQALAATASTPSQWLTFPCYPGTPGLDTYPAGRTEWWILAMLFAAGDDGSSAWLECQLVRDLGGTSELVIRHETTSPITNAEYSVIKTHVDSSDTSDLLGKDLSLRIRSVTDSVTATARIAVMWSDANHSTRVITPLSMAITGTTDHQALTAASRGFTAEQEDAARRSRHPRRQVEDFASVPLSFSSGNLFPNPIADTTIISTEQTIDRIDSSQWPGGFCRSHKIFFINGGHLRQGQGDAGDFLAIDLGNFVGLAADKTATVDFYNDGSADLMYIGGKWRLHSFYAGRDNS